MVENGKNADKADMAVPPNHGQWTAEQWRAITERDCSLLVAAAAGSGKTAVLVERIIHKITDSENPIDIDKLLVVTFTNAAAAEMRERIGDAISKALDADSDSQVLQRQLTLLNKASITTIHSFCLEVIRNNFHCIDLDPGFRISDETEATLLKLEALEELFDESYEEQYSSEAFLKLVDCYGGGKDDRRLMDIVLELFEFVQSHPWPEEWLREAAGAFDPTEEQDFGRSKWAAVLKKSISIELSGLYVQLKEALEEIRNTEGLESYIECFQADIDSVSLLLEKCSSEAITWDELYNGFSALSFDKLKPARKGADEEIKERAQNTRKAVKELVNKLKADVFYTDSRGIDEEMVAMHSVFNCLCTLVMGLGTKYSAKKREKGIIDFNDLEHFCLAILSSRDQEGRLVPSDTAAAYKERFEEIYIDEYQDSNLVQEVILNVISRAAEGKPNVFMVGDVKQSIYRFRQARPELFLGKYNSYSADRSTNERKILLYKNFRSRNEIIDAVNYVFGQIMSRSVGELDYNADEALNFGAFYSGLEDEKGIAGGDVELNVIDINYTKSLDNSGEDEETEEAEGLSALEDSESGPSDSAPQEEEIPDQIRCEARVAVNRIRELLNENRDGKRFMVFDKSMKKYRPLEYRDIVILLRATQNWAAIFAEELAKQGIPAYADTGSGYFKTVEVATMLSLLQVIDNPLQDIPLLSVLRSPIGAFTPEELIDIRLTDKEVPLYVALQKAMADEAEDISAEVKAKIRTFEKRLTAWRDKAGFVSTDELIWFLYDDTGYYSFAGAMPGGVQRQANLRILYERARQYEQTSFKGLFNFINFINKLKSSKGDMGSAKILGENENVVRIMSIHKSKGLEFPVVLLAGTGKNFNMMDMNKKILLHQDLGLGPDFVDSERRITYPTVLKQAIRHKIRLESISEEMRILYVAFTRAKEKLIIIGSVNGMEKAAARWASSAAVESTKLPEHEVLKCRSYLDWIGSCLVRHRHGEKLRTACSRNVECGQVLVNDSSIWSVKLWSMEDILADSAARANDAEELVQKLDALAAGEAAAEAEAEPEYMEYVAKRLQWEYPYKLAEKLPTRLTVTELKRSFAAEFAEEYDASAIAPALVKRPRFMEESTELTAAEKGTAMHFVMQHLDLTKPLDEAGTEKQIAEMLEKELLTEQQAQVVNVQKISRFFKLELGQRMLAASTIHREVPFNIPVKCTEIFPEAPADIYDNEQILLQGVIDCYFEEAGGLVLLDYKTDYVAPGGGAELKEKYRIQLEHYAAALEKITGKKVKEKYLFLFWNGELVEY